MKSAMPDSMNLPSASRPRENSERIFERQNNTVSIESNVNEVEAKVTKNVTEVFRDIDEKKIQSNTKDIEDESDNILQTRRVQILTTTIAPSRTTLPNTFSNSGGNGGTLDNVQILTVDSVTAKRQRRRRRRHHAR